MVALLLVAAALLADSGPPQRPPEFYVHGDVAAPGYFPVTGLDTVATALAQAGGLNASANPGKILLIRDGMAWSLVETPGAFEPLRASDRIVVFRKHPVQVRHETPEHPQGR